MKTLLQENFSSLEYWTIWQMQGEARVLIKVLSTENVSFLIDEIFTTLFWSFLSKQFRRKHWLSLKLLGGNVAKVWAKLEMVKINFPSFFVWG